jgi:hypothetical protein
MPRQNLARLLRSYLSEYLHFSRPCVQELLDNPNPNSPAQSDAYMAFTQNLPLYKKEVKKQTARCVVGRAVCGGRAVYYATCFATHSPGLKSLDWSA